MFDVLIVGSGPAGVSSALALPGKNVAILDVGKRSVEAATSSFDDFIGANFSGLENLTNPSISPKLRAPGMRFITDRPEQDHARVHQDGFQAVMSYAAGGLANAWGAGVFEFSEQDLRGFPYSSHDLRPFYNILHKEIGVSGSADDDLAEYWGPAVDLQPALKLSPVADQILSAYKRNRKAYNDSGFTVGRPRLAILTQDYGGRRAFAYDNTEFYRPNNPAIYHPGYTLDKLISEKKVNYFDGQLVSEYHETPDGIEVFTQDLKSSQRQIFKAKKLILAAGALQSAAIVLRSNRDFSSEVPLMDNPISFLPIIFPRLFGTAAKRNYYGGAELVLVSRPKDQAIIQASIYSLAGVMRSDLVREFPFYWAGNLWAARYFSPAIGVAQFFYPDSIQRGNFLKINAAGSINIRYRKVQDSNVETSLARLLRKSGFICFSSLAKRPVSGSSIHYAGTLPMNSSYKYHTKPNGQLSGTRNVYVADAASFPSLSSKNLTLTIMANAMRIASQIPN